MAYQLPDSFLYDEWLENWRRKVEGAYMRSPLLMALLTFPSRSLRMPQRQKAICQIFSILLHHPTDFWRKLSLLFPHSLTAEDRIPWKTSHIPLPYINKQLFGYGRKFKFHIPSLFAFSSCSCYVSTRQTDDNISAWLVTFRRVTELMTRVHDWRQKEKNPVGGSWISTRQVMQQPSGSYITQ